MIVSFGQDPSTGETLPAEATQDLASYSYRMPFQRPTQAGFYTPQLPPTAFHSDIAPFPHTMLPLMSFRPRLPSGPGLMRPGYVAPGAANNPRGRLPAAMPAPVPLDPAARTQTLKGFGDPFQFPGRTMMTFREGPAPGTQIVASLTPPQPQAAAPSGRPAGASYPYGSRDAFPARTMREGILPQFRSTAAGIRAGVAGSSGIINRLMPQAFAARNRQIENVWDPSRAY